MKAYAPRTFRTGGIVDVEDVNDNLLHLARDIRRSQDRRYSYSSVVIPLDGLVNTDTAAERTVPFPRARDSGGDTYPVDVVGVELSIYAADTETWTLAVTDELGNAVSIDVEDGGGATVEAYGSSGRPLLLKTADELLFSLSCTGASTIVRGVLVLHIRCDRWVQNSGARTGYTPTLLDASTADQAAAINAQMALAEAAVADDEGSNEEMRCSCFAFNDLSAAQIARWMAGAGAVAKSQHLYVVGAAARSVAALFTYSAIPAASTVTVNTVDTSTMADGFATDARSRSDDPLNDVADFTVTLTPTGGAIARVFAFLWWS